MSMMNKTMTAGLLALLATATTMSVVAQEQAPQTAESTPELIYSGDDLTPGETLDGELQAVHPQMDDGTHADCFQLHPRAGAEYTVTLRSNDFDSYLLVGVGSCADVLVQFENDDFEDESLDSQVVFAAEYDLYSVYVNTYNPGATGAYTLSVEHRMLPLPGAD